MEKYIIPSHADQPTAGVKPARPAVRRRVQPAQPVPVAAPPERAGGPGPDCAPSCSDLRHRRHLRHALADGRRQHVRLRPLRRRHHQAGLHQHLPARPAGVGVGDRAAAVLRDVRRTAAPTASWTCSIRRRAAPAKQWKYTNAPDADARADPGRLLGADLGRGAGQRADVAATVAKAAKMGDYLRYAMFDKYFKRIGNCVGAPGLPGGTGQPGKDCAAALPDVLVLRLGRRDRRQRRLGLADRLQPQPLRLPEPDRGLGADQRWASFKPRSPTARRRLDKSFERQLEFYTWLQSAEGGIAGGATNSWDGATPRRRPARHVLRHVLRRRRSTTTRRRNRGSACRPGRCSGSPSCTTRPATRRPRRCSTSGCRGRSPTPPSAPAAQLRRSRRQ